MKRMIKTMIILCAAVALCCIVLGVQTVQHPVAKVVARSVKEFHERTPALDIQLAVVDQPLEEWHEELNVVDSIVYIPEDIAVKAEEEPEIQLDAIAIEEQEIIEDTVIEECIEYEEPILMAKEIGNGVLFVEGDGYDNESYEEIVYSTAKDEVEIVIDEEAIEEEKLELEIIEEETEINLNQQEEERDAAAPVTNGGIKQQIVDYARSRVGVTPYVSWYDRMENGVVNNSLDTGTDCSGFVSLVYDTFGVVTSATSDDYQAMSNISYEELEPGDIVVYGDGSHVAIYEGDDMVIHCSNPESGTIESNINYREPTGYVRIIEDQVYEEEYGDD